MILRLINTLLMLSNLTNTLVDRLNPIELWNKSLYWFMALWIEQSFNSWYIHNSEYVYYLGDLIG